MIDLLIKAGKLGAKFCSAWMIQKMQLAGNSELHQEPKKVQEIGWEAELPQLLRPIIAFVVKVASQVMSSSLVHHWTRGPRRGILYANHEHSRIECL